MMNRAALVSTHVGRAGVHALARLVESRGHAFREHFVHDLGIDAHIELFDHYGNPTGRFVAVQIKSGSSYFRGCRENLAAYHFAERHRTYWQQHQMPVILVLHDPDTGRLIWQHVCSRNVVRSAKRWRIDVPLANDLSAPGSFAALEAISASKSDILALSQKPRARRLQVYQQINPNSPHATHGYPFCATNEGHTSLLVISKECLCYCSKNYLAPDEFNNEYAPAGFSLEFNTESLNRAIRSVFDESNFEVQFEPERDGGRFTFFNGAGESYFIKSRGEAGIDVDPSDGLTLLDATQLFGDLQALFSTVIGLTNSDLYRKVDGYSSTRQRVKVTLTGVH